MPGRVRHHLAQHGRALASAGDQNLERGGFVEFRERQGAEPRDRFTHRIADQLHLAHMARLQSVDFSIGRRDRGGRSGQQAVDPAQHRILFMQDGGNPHRIGGEQRWKGRISAEADHRVGGELAIERLGLAPPGEHREKCLDPADESAAQPARGQDMGRHILEQRRDLRSAIVGDQHHAMAARLQLCGKRMGRDHMPAGAPGGEGNVH
jgi:hypothetical protein